MRFLRSRGSRRPPARRIAVRPFRPLHGDSLALVQALPPLRYDRLHLHLRRPVRDTTVFALVTDAAGDDDPYSPVVAIEASLDPAFLAVVVLQDLRKYRIPSLTVTPTETQPIPLLPVYASTLLDIPRSPRAFSASTTSTKLSSPIGPTRARASPRLRSSVPSVQTNASPFSDITFLTHSGTSSSWSTTVPRRPNKRSTRHSAPASNRNRAHLRLTSLRVQFWPFSQPRRTQTYIAPASRLPFSSDGKVHCKHPITARIQSRDLQRVGTGRGACSSYCLPLERAMRTSTARTRCSAQA